jgi:predicted TIM-barrel fold metal-dependent hydrolase
MNGMTNNSSRFQRVSRFPRVSRSLRASLLSAIAVASSACASRGASVATNSAEHTLTVAELRALPKIDVHAHYRADNPELIAALQTWNARAVLVTVTGTDKKIDEKWRDHRALAAAHPERFALVATFDPARFNDADFAPKVIEKLRGDIAAGAKAVKVWKDIGMEVKDASGKYIQIDDPKFQPIWDFLVSQNIPVMAHIGEPLAAWRPLSDSSPHFWYYSNNPQYHAYAHPEIPRHEEIIAARDRWIARNPKLTIVAMHLASLEYDVAEVAKRLDAYPNLYVETAARINDLAMQPSPRVREFFLKYQDRVMWGTDFGEGSVSRTGLESAFDQHWRYYGTADTVTLGNARAWHRTVSGLALPRPVLEKFAHLNAERVLKLRVVPDGPRGS